MFSTLTFHRDCESAVMSEAAEDGRAPIYRLDIESMGSTGFRNPRALGRSVPSVARALLRARGFLNLVDPIGRDV